MNLALQDPFKMNEVPEGVEDYLMDTLGSKANCVQFNRRGTYLCVGNQSGTVSLWDFQSKSISRLFIGHKQCVNSLSWTRNAKRILSGSSDGSIILWDVVTSQMITKIEFDQPILFSQLHPRDANICIVSPQNSVPVIVNLTTFKTTPIIQESTNNNNVNDNNNNNNSDQLPTDQVMKDENNNNNNINDSNTTIPTTTIPTINITSIPNKCELVAKYSWKGGFIAVGDNKGNITFYNSNTLEVEKTFKIAAAVKEFEFSRDQKYLLINSVDKIIRLYSLEASTVVRDYHESVNRVQWKSCCFSHNSEYIIAGMQHKTMQTLFVWNVGGGLVKDLEGPKEGFQYVCWHPLKPLIVTVSSYGIIYIWSTIYTDNWSSFAPDFTELEENEEYQEREDEFDNKDEEEAAKAEAKRIEMERLVKLGAQDVDVLSIDPIAAFSSDEEEDVYLFPTIPDAQ